MARAGRVVGIFTGIIFILPVGRAALYEFRGAARPTDVLGVKRLVEIPENIIDILQAN